MTSVPASRLDVGVVGAGRVGAVLGSALRGVGHRVVAASGVSEASRERIELLLGGVDVLEVPEVVTRSELVLLTVPDDTLAELIEGLARLGAWRPGQVVVHTSGRYGTAVLEPARAAGVIPLALHPAMTFTGTSLDLARLTGCAFAVTGRAPVLPIGQALVVELGGEPVVVAEEDRGTYHAALSHGANHLTVLVAQAASLLREAGVTEPALVLGPLLGAGLENALRAESLDPAGDGPGAVLALTGPVVRGDVGTVQAHLDVLAARADGGTLEAYRALARSATARSLRAGRLDEPAAARLLDALDPSGRTHP